jgi:hypothetical protein
MCIWCMQVLWDLEDEEVTLMQKLTATRHHLVHARGLLDSLRANTSRGRGHAPINLHAVDLPALCLQAEGDFEELQHAIAVLVHSRTLLLLHLRPKTKGMKLKGKVRWAHPLEEVEYFSRDSTIKPLAEGESEDPDPEPEPIPSSGQEDSLLDGEGEQSESISGRDSPRSASDGSEMYDERSEDSTFEPVYEGFDDAGELEAREDRAEYEDDACGGDEEERELTREEQEYLELMS